MEIFDIKKGYAKKIEGKGLTDLMKDIFGNAEAEGDWISSNYGAMRPIRARMGSGSELVIEIVTVKVPDDQVLDTMKKRNLFLEAATGFDSKTRLKRLKEKAKGGSL
ncbi:MAG: DUF5611 family protein [Candidatus Thermoplasmatota archaeon]|nr:DUF5611 family protein [Candidatus Thermoplasmatota archaeon]